MMKCARCCQPNPDDLRTDLEARIDDESGVSTTVPSCHAVASLTPFAMRMVTVLTIHTMI